MDKMDRIAEEQNIINDNLKKIKRIASDENFSEDDVQYLENYMINIREAKIRLKKL